MDTKDHFSPQVHLRGFIAPDRTSQDKPLSVFVLSRHRWEDKSPSQLGYLRGFESAVDPAIEARVRGLLKSGEDAWPETLEAARKSNYQGWRHKLCDL